MSFIKCALSGLDQADSVLSISLSLLQTTNLTSHFFRDSQTSSVITSAVNSHTTGKSFHGLAGVGLIYSQLPLVLVSVELRL